jgi:hypothetical protein
MKPAAIFSSFLVASIAIGTAAALSVDPPDLEVNAVSGLIETVDATWSGSNYNVRYTVMNASGFQSTSQLLSTNTQDDVDPRIAINPTGNAYVAWWRDLSTDAVLYRKHNYTTGAWGAERAVGLATESNSRPRVLSGGGKIWVCYQIQNARSRSIGVQIIDDDPEPVRSVIGTTSYTGDIDLQIQYEAGHLWVTWIDTASRVAYTEYSYDKRVWSSTAYEYYSGDSVDAARSRIRSRVLNYLPN